jgi:hypothetical protein
MPGKGSLIGFADQSKRQCREQLHSFKYGDWRANYMNSARMVRPSATGRCRSEVLPPI